MPQTYCPYQSSPHFLNKCSQALVNSQSSEMLISEKKKITRFPIVFIEKRMIRGLFSALSIDIALDLTMKQEENNKGDSINQVVRVDAEILTAICPLVKALV